MQRITRPEFDAYETLAVVAAAVPHFSFSPSLRRRMGDCVAVQDEDVTIL